MWNLSLFFQLGKVFDANKKNCSSILIFIYRQCFEFYQPLTCIKNVSTFFKFALAFSMLQVYSTHINTKNEYEIKVWLKRNCVWFGKHIARAIAQAKLFKHWTQLFVSSEDLKNQLGNWFKLKTSWRVCIKYRSVYIN